MNLFKHRSLKTQKDPHLNWHGRSSQLRTFNGRHVSVTYNTEFKVTESYHEVQARFHENQLLCSEIITEGDTDTDIMIL
jgi:hypothetical protein